MFMDSPRGFMETHLGPVPERPRGYGLYWPMGQVLTDTDQCQDGAKVHGSDQR